MRRIVTARQQAEMLAPWLRLAAPPLADPVTPAAPPAPKKEWDGLPGEPWTHRLKKFNPEDSEDPINDPANRLKKVDYTFENTVDNLHSHLLAANSEQHRQGRHWYNVARQVFGALAKDHGISKARAVAIGAAFSPLTDWGENIKHAADFILRYRPEDPNHNENDWMMAHLHPQALQSFRVANGGRNPTHSDEDLHQLADLHAAHFKRGPNLDKINNLADPQARAAWMGNIQHHGMDKVLADHEKQVFDNRLKKDDNGNPVPYNPSEAMRDAGIPTLGSSIAKAKQLIKAPEDPKEFYRILGGPKIWNFSRNILHHPGWNGAWGRRNGYYLHPNGDWTQHEDLGGTIDAHHLRAASMKHGEWIDSGYHDGSAGLDISSPATYDTFNRSLLEATRRYNSGISDPTNHITPKQAQAIIWKKHKDDNEWFRRHKVQSEGELPQSLRKVPVGFSKDPKKYFKTRAPKKFRRRVLPAALTPQDLMNMPPVWRQMFMERVAPEWQDLLSSHMEHFGLHSSPEEEAAEEGRLAALDPEILHQKRHDIGQHLAPENHPTDSWADCPNCSWYGLGDERDWNPDQSQDPFDPRMIGASRDPLLADVAEALNFSAAVVKRASPSSSAVYVLLPHWDPEACVGILNAHHSAAQGRVALPVMDEKWTSDVMDAAKKGGFTLRDHVGDGPTSGHMVSLYKDSEFKRPIRELNADDVRNFVSKNAEALDKPHHYLGGWLEGGHFYLDVSVHVPEMNRATTEAVRNHQLGIYDLNNGRTLDTSEAGYLTGHPGVVGSRNDGPVSPSAQGRRRADRRDHAGGGGPHRR